MTPEQGDRVVKALANADLETIKASRELAAVLETAALALRARLAQIEGERQRAIVAALGEQGGERG